MVKKCKLATALGSEDLKESKIFPIKNCKVHMFEDSL